jgi:hypothetical protein
LNRCSANRWIPEKSNARARVLHHDVIARNRLPTMPLGDAQMSRGASVPGNQRLRGKRNYKGAALAAMFERITSHPMEIPVEARFAAQRTREFRRALWHVHVAPKFTKNLPAKILVRLCVISVRQLAGRPGAT